jgi:hypothetical protein
MRQGAAQGRTCPGGPEPTRLPLDAGAATLAHVLTPGVAVRAHADSSAPWAALAAQVLAGLIGEQVEDQRCARFLTDCAPAAATALR